mmetsp:Transcript_23444/g.65654  ORF Transcript_23444/g.65654 Transcript_23444/m.65654 type:complete len:237 (-) Transcript_23444:48-758(-)
MRPFPEVLGCGQRHARGAPPPRLQFFGLRLLGGGRALRLRRRAPGGCRPHPVRACLSPSAPRAQRADGDRHLAERQQRFAREALGARLHRLRDRIHAARLRLPEEADSAQPAGAPGGDRGGRRAGCQDHCHLELRRGCEAVEWPGRRVLADGAHPRGELLSRVPVLLVSAGPPRLGVCGRRRVPHGARLLPLTRAPCTSTDPGARAGAGAATDAGTGRRHRRHRTRGPMQDQKGQR